MLQDQTEESIVKEMFERWSKKYSSQTEEKRDLGDVREENKKSVQEQKEGQGILLRNCGTMFRS